MVRYTELSVYMHPDDAAAVHDAAAEQGYETTSEYVRECVPECDTDG